MTIVKSDGGIVDACAEQAALLSKRAHKEALSGAALDAEVAALLDGFRQQIGRSGSDVEPEDVTRKLATRLRLYADTLYDEMPEAKEVLLRLAEGVERQEA
ncbi:hypothetical protein FMZ60_06055 [Alcaligenaceae bacterium SJ-26]|nr:hypothetical protein FMZ60_06055 [Alcaligenaceae bacterium SJ-26]